MFRRICLFLALSFALAALAQSGPDSRHVTDPKSLTAPTNPQAGPVPIDDLYYTRSIGGATWSADGKEIAFSTNLTGRTNVWKVNAAGGWPIQLSQSDDRELGATWSPDGKWIVYQSDRGGAETYDLFAIPAAGGEAVNLTNTPQLSETGPVWSRDGKQLLITLKPKTSPVFDAGVFDLGTHQARNLTHESAQDQAWTPRVFGPDGKVAYAVRRNAGFTDSSIYRLDLSSGAKEELTPHQGQNRFDVTDVSPDGKTLLITADKPGGYPNVALLDVATKKITWVTDTQWEAGSGNFSPDGKRFTYELNADGRLDVYLADTASRAAQKLNVPAGLNTYAGDPTAFSPDGTRLLVSHQASNQPGDLWVYDIARRQARQLSYSAIASLNSASLPPSQLVHYKSFDGKIISAFLWLPFNLKRDGSNPGIVMPHGGPTGQTVDSFNRTAEALASRGYVCIAPNVRGSTGYGMEFQKANFQDLGGGDLQDEVYAARFLQDTGYVDGKKIGITGGSYGGYMTLMAIGKTPDVWAAAVESYGIIDWLTMLQHEDPYLQEYEKTLLGDPEKDRAAYENASPIKFIRNDKAPLLVLQGENDIRVPKEEAEQVVRILQQEGKTVDVHYYPQEGHGFQKRENQVDAIRRTVAWFDKYLKGSQ
ncbi:MAG TPA: S9 family peptidase [Terriglobales bacterium]|nr:S9 family peptidase [Terriglobales bacterium]